MAKATNNPVETMRLGIEFADNGIILRNPDIVARMKHECDAKPSAIVVDMPKPDR